MKKTDLSIIIVSWNVQDYLKGCLESIFETVKDLEFEIFVVDNNSKDGTVEFVKEHFPQVKLIANKNNLGFAKANNKAIIRSDGSYVLLLNPDTILLPEAVTKMVDYLETHKEYGAVGPKILNEDRGTVQGGAYRNFPSISSSFIKLINGDSWLKRTSNQLLYGKNSIDTNAIPGACIMVRKGTIDEVGMLDEEFFMYGEDVEWCYRINKGGWKIFYLAEAAIIHYGEKSAVIKYTEGENMAENFNAYFIYFKKHHGVLYATCFRAMVGIAMMGWNLFWIAMLLVRVKSKDKIKKTITRNNKLIRWSVNADGVKYIGTTND